MTTDNNLLAGAAATPLLDRLGALSLSNGLRLTSEPRRGRHGSMKHYGYRRTEHIVQQYEPSL